MIEEKQKLENAKMEILIYEVRGQLVMLDSDLADLFDYETKNLNRNFKNNIDKFLEENVFQLTNEEIENLRCTTITSSGVSGTSSLYGGRRYLPYVFTLEGIKILSTILKKPTVPVITLEIEEAFKKLENVNNKSLAIPVSKGEKIENLIYNIRGKQVMLDFDLARIYECKNGTKTVIQAFKRNINRFPDEFYFQLTEDEFLKLRSQFGTANGGAMSRSLPYAFTEPGVYTLASILRTKLLLL